MFHYLNGILAYRDASTAVIDCGGVGYRLSISANTADAIAHSLATKVKLLTYLQVREDGIELFGFYTQEEHDCFKLLIGVSGVGPKAALSILSVLTPDALRLAVISDDVKALSKAQNIGKKTAERILLELRDKVAKGFLEGMPTSSGSPVVSLSAEGQLSGKMSDALEALIALGYEKSEAMSALRDIDPATHDVNQMIALALKKFL